MVIKGQIMKTKAAGVMKIAMKRAEEGEVVMMTVAPGLPKR